MNEFKAITFNNISSFNFRKDTSHSQLGGPLNIFWGTVTSTRCIIYRSCNECNLNSRHRQGTADYQSSNTVYSGDPFARWQVEDETPGCINIMTMNDKRLSTFMKEGLRA